MRSASIAERSLTTLERPWIFIELSLDLQGSPEDPVQNRYALFDIANYGRGPAIIEQFHGEISSAELQPSRPLLRDEFHGVVGPGRAREKCMIECPNGFTYRNSSNPTFDTSFPIPNPANHGWEVFLRIIIDYRDIAGDAHQSAFCWRYDCGVCRWVKFEEEPGGRAYNYLT